jgi:hypothetical protein
MVLAHTAFLGSFIPKDGASIVEPYWLRLVVHSMLNICPANRRCTLGPQGDSVTTAVFEGIHLLLHNIGTFADTAKEQLSLLKYRSIDALVLEEPTDFSCLCLNDSPVILIFR